MKVKIQWSNGYQLQLHCHQVTENAKAHRMVEVRRLATRLWRLGNLSACPCLNPQHCLHLLHLYSSFLSFYVTPNKCLNLHKALQCAQCSSCLQKIPCRSLLHLGWKITVQTCWHKFIPTNGSSTRRDRCNICKPETIGHNWGVQNLTYRLGHVQRRSQNMLPGTAANPGVNPQKTRNLLLERLNYLFNLPTKQGKGHESTVDYNKIMAACDCIAKSLCCRRS